MWQPNSTPKTCPDCGQGLKPNTTRCKCGWELPHSQTKSRVQISNADKRPPRDLQCGYRHLGARCPLPGTVTATVGLYAPFYCTGYFGQKGHLQTLDDPEEALEILHFNQAHYAQIMDEYRHSRNWRDVLVEAERQKIAQDGSTVDHKALLFKWATQHRIPTASKQPSRRSLTEVMSHLKIFKEEE